MEGRNAYSDVEWKSEVFKGSDFEKLTLVAKRLMPRSVACVIIFVVLGILYSLYKPSSFRSSSLILINEEKEKMGSGSSQRDLLKALSISQYGTNVDNEIHILKSDYLFSKAVAQLGLQMEFQKSDQYGRRKILYGDQLPFKIIIDSSSKNLEAIEGYIRVYRNGLVINPDSINPIKVSFGQSVKLPFGYVRFLRIDKETKTTIPGDIHYRFLSLEAATKKYSALLTSELEDKKTTLIRLGIQTEDPYISADLLNTLVQNYRQSNLDDNKRIVDSTISFISVRLDSVSQELNGIEKQIESFKVNNEIADFSTQSKVAIEEIGVASEKQSELQTQISVVNSLLDYMQKNIGHPRIIPASLTIQNVSLTEAINGYNTLLFQKDRLLVNYKENSSLVEDIARQISESRADLVNNLHSVKQSLMASLSDVTSQLGKRNSKIKDIPIKERIFLNFNRQQSIKQELYLFLLQKKEEAAISRSSTVSNCKVVDIAKPEIVPVAPKRKSILLVSGLMGAVMPFVFFYMRRLFSFKIRGREDLVTLIDKPIVGEISYVPSSKFQRKKNNIERSILKEQFRILRSNMQFLLNNQPSSCILVNSSIASEGKSFFTINLASILAISSKKVVILEFDLRKPVISEHFRIHRIPGFTDYISGACQIQDIIKETDHKNVFVVPSGTKAPNPTELLMRKGTEDLFKTLRSSFDYIIVDCAPNIVADAKVLTKYTDLTLFIVRTGFTPKSYIRELSRMDSSRPLGIVLNCVNTDHRESYYKYYN